MKKVNKKPMDELIRISRKYWDTGDVDFLDARYKYAYELSEQAFDNTQASLSFVDIVDSAVKFNKQITNEAIYAMFAIVGIFVDQEDAA